MGRVEDVPEDLPTQLSRSRSSSGRRHRAWAPCLPFKTRRRGDALATLERIANGTTWGPDLRPLAGETPRFRIYVVSPGVVGCVPRESGSRRGTAMLLTAAQVRTGPQAEPSLPAPYIARRRSPAAQGEERSGNCSCFPGETSWCNCSRPRGPATSSRPKESVASSWLYSPVPTSGAFRQGVPDRRRNRPQSTTLLSPHDCHEPCSAVAHLPKNQEPGNSTPPGAMCKRNTWFFCHTTRRFFSTPPRESSGRVVHCSCVRTREPIAPLVGRSGISHG